MPYNFCAMTHNHPATPLPIPHRHDPNYDTPPGDGAFEVVLPTGEIQAVNLLDLQRLPVFTLDNCYIVSTGHGTSGPFRFTGARLIDLVRSLGVDTSSVGRLEIISADGFGNVLWPSELEPADPHATPLLAYCRDEQPLTRADGLVRLIVPTETTDALRQVKWVATIKLLSSMITGDKPQATSGV